MPCHYKWLTPHTRELGCQGFDCCVDCQYARDATWLVLLRTVTKFHEKRSTPEFRRIKVLANGNSPSSLSSYVDHATCRSETNTVRHASGGEPGQNDRTRRNKKEPISNKSNIQPPDVRATTKCYYNAADTWTTRRSPEPTAERVTLART